MQHIYLNYHPSLEEEEGFSRRRLQGLVMPNFFETISCGKATKMDRDL